MEKIREDAIERMRKKHKFLCSIDTKNTYSVYAAMFDQEDIEAFQMILRSAESLDFIRVEIYSRMKRTEDRAKYFGMSEALNVIDEIERSYIEDGEQ